MPGMGNAAAELQVVVNADTSKAEAGLSSLGSKVSSAGSALAGLAAGAVVAGVAGLAAGFAGAVAAAGNFEQAMSAIKAVSGSTGAEMEQLSKLALDLGKQTSFSATEAAAGIEELVKAGVSIQDVLGGGAAAALNLAAAGGLSVAESATIASNAMNVFNLTGADVGHVADTIAGAANASAIDVHDFGFSLSAVGAVAAGIGVSFDSLATAIAAMGNSGIKGSDAGTSLKAMLNNLSPSTKSATKEMRALGIITADGANQFFDATGKAKSMSEIAGVLAEATKNLTAEQKINALQTLFGTDGQRAALVLAKEGAAGMDALAASIGKVTAADVAATRLDNLKGSLEQLKGSLETAAIGLGTIFLPAIRSMVDGLTAGVNAAIEIIGKLPDAWADVQAIFSGGATSGGLQAMLTQLGISEATITFVQDWVKRLGDAWRTVQQVFANDWTPSNQIDPFVNAIGISATKLRDFGQQMSDAWGTLKQALSGDWSPSASIDPFVNSVGIAATKVRDFVLAIQEAVTKAGEMGAWDNVATSFKNLGDAGTIVKDRFGEISTTIGGLLPPMREGATAADVLAAAIAGGALGLQIASVQVKGFVDAIGSSINVFLNFGSGISQMGVALQKLQAGDIPGALAALGSARDAFAAGAQAAEDFRTRGIERAGEATAAMAGLVGIHMPAVATAVQAASGTAVTDLDAIAVASLAAGTDIATLQPTTETAMTAVAVATETQMAAASDSVTTYTTTISTTTATQLDAALASATTDMTGIATTTETNMAASSDSATTHSGTMSSTISAAMSAILTAVTSDGGSAKTSFVGQMADMAAACATPAGALDKLASTAASFWGWLNSHTFNFHIELPTLPSWAIPGSPTPFEVGLRGIADALGEVDDVSMSSMNATLVSLTKAITDLTTTIAELITKLAKDVPATTAKMATDVKTKMTDMATVSGQQASAMAEAVRQQTMAMAADANTLVGTMSNAVSTTVQTMSSAVGTTVGTMWQDVTDRTAGATQLISGTIDSFTATVLQISEQLRLGVTSDSALMADTVTGTISNMTTDVDALIGTMTAGVVAKTQVMRDTVTTTINGLWTDVTNRTAGATHVISATVDSFTAEVMRITRELQTGVTTAAKTTQTETVKAFTGMTEMSLDSIGVFAQGSMEEFDNVVKAAGKIPPSVDEINEAMSNMEPPDTGPIVNAYNEIADAAHDAAKEAKKAADALSEGIHNGGKGGGGRALGGAVSAGVSYLVGERGPEMFTPFSGGFITPHKDLISPSGGGGYSTHVFVIQDPAGRTLEEWYVKGRDLAVKRGRD